MAVKFAISTLCRTNFPNFFSQRFFRELETLTLIKLRCQESEFFVSRVSLAFKSPHFCRSSTCLTGSKKLDIHVLLASKGFQKLSGRRSNFGYPTFFTFYGFKVPKAKIFPIHRAIKYNFGAAIFSKLIVGIGKCLQI